jgi:putative flippase GtrA
LKNLIKKILKFELNPFFKRLIIYLILGVTINIFVGIIYFTFIFLNINTILSLSIAYIIGVILSIYYNKKITFKYKNKNKNIWIKFGLTHCLAYFICQFSNESIIFLLMNNQYSLTIGFIISIAFAAMTNFIGMNIIMKNENNI